MILKIKLTLNKRYPIIYVISTKRGILTYEKHMNSAVAHRPLQAFEIKQVMKNVYIISKNHILSLF